MREADAGAVRSRYTVGVGGRGLLVESQDFKSRGGPVGSAVGSIPTCSRQVLEFDARREPDKPLNRESTWRSIRANFLTGLVTILPAGVTLFIAFRVYLFLNNILAPVLPGIPGLGLLVELVLVTLLGALVNNVIGERFSRVLDSVFGRTPLIRGLYETSKQLVSTFLSKEGQARAFRQVVLVPYSMGQGGNALAFVVSEETFNDGVTRVGCFVPFSPPTGGLLLFFPREQITPTDLRVEDAMKMMLTGGALSPGTGPTH